MSPQVFDLATLLDNCVRPVEPFHVVARYRLADFEICFSSLCTSTPGTTHLFRVETYFFMAIAIMHYCLLVLPLIDNCLDIEVVQAAHDALRKLELR